MLTSLHKKPFIVLLFLSISAFLKAQSLTDIVDTTTILGKSVLSVTNRFNNIHINGYIQPQFQIAQSKGAKSYNGGDFAPYADNRFMIRRGRLRFEYVHSDTNTKPTVQFVFQFDGTEKGVFIRDFWGRILENNYKLFAFTIGMFSRPFSYEVNLGSSDRESPERGRMSQILMKGEHDLGAMVTFEPREKDHPLRYLKIDAGFFNGPGLNAPADYDSHKDFISRLTLKPYALLKAISLSAGLSYFNGGIMQNTKYVYKFNRVVNSFSVDSSVNNIGKILPRKYYGADVQLKIKNGWGYTELRAEFMTGKQSAFSNTSETPAALPADNTTPFYVRNFNGAYFYLVQNIVNVKNQIAIKYDWYDPNRDVAGSDIGKAGTNVNEANIKFSTLGFGYINYLTENVKLVFWYEKVTNEKTQLPGYTADVKDDVFTCRFQFRF